jgi:hypothetical protein
MMPPLHTPLPGRAARRVFPLFALALSLPAHHAGGVDFRAGNTDGLLNLNLSYGALFRTDGRNRDIIALGNGGRAADANSDDGTLNYDTGLVSNMIEASGELGLYRGPFVAYARGIAFYDFEQEQGNREHRQFESADLDAIGSGTQLRDYYVGAQFTPGGMPVMLRVGEQVVNWGETTFIRDGVDTISPLDLLGSLQPARIPRHSRQPLGMVRAAANITETFALEGFYQYEWQPVTLPPAGYFLSPVDIVGEGRRKFLQLGDGQFSDLGTDLDAAFALPDGTLGFDEAFLQMPQRQTKKPNDGGQYGIALTQITHWASALKWGVHYIRYHSRLPIVSGVTASQAAIDMTDPAEVERIAGALAPVYGEQGLSGEEAAAAAQATASQLALSRYANQAGYFLEYPEDISMIAVTFNTSTLRTGTFIAAEISHHMDTPMQLALGSVVSASLSPVKFNPNFSQGPLGNFGADATISGYERLDRTQFAYSALRQLRGRFGAVQTLVGVDGAWVHIHDYPGAGESPLQAPGGGDPDSWGYRLLAQLTYTNVFGALNMRPRIAFVHDVAGYTPAPYETFWEGRKAVSLGVGADYIDRVTADLSYTTFFGGGSANPLQDRDHIRFNIAYWF